MWMAVLPYSVSSNCLKEAFTEAWDMACGHEKLVD